MFKITVTPQTSVLVCALVSHVERPDELPAGTVQVECAECGEGVWRSPDSIPAIRITLYGPRMALVHGDPVVLCPQCAMEHSWAGM